MIDRITRAVFGRKPIRPRSGKTKHLPRFFDFMVWIKTQFCIVPGCGIRPCDAAHVGDHAGWRKADDRTCLPICHFEHHQFGALSIHKLGRRRFFEHFGLDPRALWRKFNGLYLLIDPGFTPLEVCS